MTQDNDVKSDFCVHQQQLAQPRPLLLPGRSCLPTQGRAEMDTGPADPRSWKHLPPGPLQSVPTSNLGEQSSPLAADLDHLGVFKRNANTKRCDFTGWPEPQALLLCKSSPHSR